MGTDLYSILELGSVPFVYVVFEICGNGSVIDLRGKPEDDNVFCIPL